MNGNLQNVTWSADAPTVDKIDLLYKTGVDRLIQSLAIPRNILDQAKGSKTDCRAFEKDR